MEKLIEKSTTDKMRIYYHKGLDYPYMLYVNDISDGDPCYAYRTLKGAKLAMRKFEKGRYKGKPSTKW